MVAHEWLTQPRVTIEGLLPKPSSLLDLPAFLDLKSSYFLIFKIYIRPGKKIKDVLKNEGFSDTADYICDANKEILLFINIESVEGVENLENLLAIDGVDGVFIGK